MRARLALLLGVLASTAACRIFALAPVPCSNENAVQECADGEVCVDGACTARPASPASCDEQRVEDPLTRQRLVVGATQERGAAVLRSGPWGASPDLVADFECAPNCAFIAGRVPAARAPLIGVTAAASLADGPLTMTDSARNSAAPFAIEVLFRSPTTSDTTIAGSSTNNRNGWRIETRAGGTHLRVGENSVTLAEDSAGVWTYALCVVDMAQLVALRPGGLLCSADGQVRAPPSDVKSPTPATAPLVFGQDGGNDGVVAFLRTWSLHAAPDFPDASAALAAVADEGRERLLRYLGVDVQTGGQILVSNTTGRPRVVELPALGPEPAAVAWVGDAWPRVVERSPTFGVERTPVPGILFEPRSVNLLTPIEACSVRIVGPTGRVDACSLHGTPASAKLEFTTELERNTPFVLSVFYRVDADASEAAADGGLYAVFEDDASQEVTVCGVSSNAARPCADAFSSPELVDFGEWKRFIWATSFGFPVSKVTLMSRSSSVWAPQLEAGTRATSPIGFTDAGGGASLVRDADMLVIDQASLGVTQDISMTATILDAVGRAQPLTLLDDDDDDDGVLRLTAERTAGTRDDPPGMTVTLDGRAGQSVTASTFERNADTNTVAVHVGKGADPLEPCAACVQTNVVPSAPLQVETVRILGPHAVLKEVKVDTLGRTPRPTALDLHVEPMTPDACVADEPLFTFQGCPNAPCPLPGIGTAWDAASSSTAPTPSALPAETGLAGRRTTDLSGASALGALLLEARFRSPDAGSGGNVVTVRGDSRTGLRLVANNPLGFELIVQVGASASSLGVVSPGEWNQVVCLFDRQSRCIVNLGDPTLLDELAPTSGGKLLAAIVGDDASPIHVAFARGSWVRGAPDGNEADVLLRTRAADRFGLRVADRRQTALVRELRSSSSFVSLLDAEQTLRLVRVGPRWPRIEDIGRGPVYVTGPGGTNALANALREPGVGDVEVVGPHPALPAQRVEPGARSWSPLSSPGVVSLFVAPADLAEDRLPDDVLRLRSGAHGVTLEGGDGERPGGVLRYGVWQRVWLRVLPDEPVVLELLQPVRVAALMYEPEAVSPGAPPLPDSLSGDRLEIVGGDLSSSGSTAALLDIDNQEVGGRFFSLERWTPVRTDAVFLERTPDAVTVVSQSSGFVINDPPESFSFEGGTGLAPLRAWWRDRQFLLGRSDGSVQVRGSAALDITPDRVFIGGGQMRLRSLHVQRGGLRDQGPRP